MDKSVVATLLFTTASTNTFQFCLTGLFIREITPHYMGSHSTCAQYRPMTRQPHLATTAMPGLWHSSPSRFSEKMA